DGIRDKLVTGVQTCALPISAYERLVAVQPTVDVRGRDGNARRAERRGRRRIRDRDRAVLHREVLVEAARWRRRSIDDRTTRRLRSEERRVGKEGRTRWSRCT